MAEARLEDTGVAALAVLVAGAQHVEQLLDHGDVADLRDRLAAGVQVAALAQRDELLHHRAKLLGLGQRGGDLLMLDQRRAHIAEHRLAMLRRAVELAVNLAVTHRIIPSSSLCRDGSSDAVSGGLPAFALKINHARLLAGHDQTVASNGPRSAWRARRYSRAASRALPCRGAGPFAPALP